MNILTFFCLFLFIGVLETHSKRCGSPQALQASLVSSGGAEVLGGGLRCIGRSCLDINERYRGQLSAFINKKIKKEQQEEEKEGFEAGSRAIVTRLSSSSSSSSSSRKSSSSSISSRKSSSTVGASAAAGCRLGATYLSSSMRCEKGISYFRQAIKRGAGVYGFQSIHCRTAAAAATTPSSLPDIVSFSQHNKTSLLYSSIHSSSTFLNKMPNPKVFFDVSIGGGEIGRAHV